MIKSFKMGNSVASTCLLIATVGVTLSSLQKALADVYDEPCQQYLEYTVDTAACADHRGPDGKFVDFVDAQREKCIAGPTQQGQPSCCSYEKYDAFCSYDATYVGFDYVFTGSHTNYICTGSHCVEVSD